MSASSLAVDIGASSGRVIASSLIDNQMNTEEIHRFENKMTMQGKYECWDIDHLYKEIIEGIRKAAARGDKPESIGIDTWAVDYVLLDKEDKLLMNPIAYRDSRTEAVIEEVHAVIPRTDLYARTGIQYQPFNTVYQLTAHRLQEPETWKQAEKLLLIPDYLNFLLTGITAAEYTNATTTQLISASSDTWDKELLEKLQIPEKLLPEIHMPGQKLGALKPELAEELGIQLDVVLPATHDTASAVAAAPMKEDAIYVSSGTWSLMGVELTKPLINEQTSQGNLTNEGGIEKRFRFLKNIMGLWMIQEIKREYEDQYSFAEFVTLAKESRLDTIVNVNDERFLRPPSMKDAILEACREQSAEEPETPGDFARCIFRSLAAYYARVVQEIEAVTGKSYPSIHVIGGGSQNEWLNELTAQESQKTVIAGPVEATAVGNLLVQFLALGKIQSLEEGRAIVKQSFPLKTYSAVKG